MLAGSGHSSRYILFGSQAFGEQEDMTPSARYLCLICGFIYDEALGLPEEGIPPGTRFEDLPMNWSCPECGARKEDFERMAG